MQALVMESLKSLPSLQTLDINLKYCRIPLKLDELLVQGLHTISLTDGNLSEYSIKIYESLARMIGKSLQLTSIDMLPARIFGKAVFTIHSLHHLVQYYPSGSPPLRLSHLGLNGCFVRLDNTTLPKLRSLKSLRLTGIIDPYSSHDNINYGEAHKQVGGTLSDFWNTLARNGIQLEDIEHEDVCSPFLNYLSAYSGLKRLKLTPDSLREGMVYANTLAKQFFTESLLAHVHSLEKLEITPRYENDWCFGRNNSSEISACVHLRKLNMSVASLRLEVILVSENGMVSGIFRSLRLILLY